MKLVIWEICVCMFLKVNPVGGLPVTDDSPSTGFNVRPDRTIFVDPSRKHGNFTTIQSAIDSVPQGNSKWVCIYIKKGIYRYVFLQD